MADVTNTNQEKHYFVHILENPDQFSKVEPYFFKNSDIMFIYSVIRDEYIRSESHTVPSINQIYSMVKLADQENKINDKVIKLLLQSDNGDISSEWLSPRFKSWKIKNQLQGDMLKGIDFVRSLDEIDYDNVVDIAQKIKGMFNNVLLVDDDDNDLGDDFDDPESHKQEISKNCIPTGWQCIDTILGGGWSKSTLNVIMGETNVGKSMWLHNIAVNAANAGENVLIITLEMANRKVFKRLGCMRLKIQTDEYDTKTKDPMFLKQRLNNLKSQVTGGNLFDQKPGKLFVKKYNTSDCTVTDIDNYVKKFEEVKRLKVGMVIVDYINIMSIEKGFDVTNMLYLKGKHLAEGLRRIGDKYECAVITATQTDKAVWGASDIKLADIPESKAIADTADSVWGIIRNPEMKRNNIYRLKILKLRDGEHHEEQVRFDFNTKFLTMENDTLVGVK
ncbi:AAA family ATPase [Candidatus Dojkabacteria bacterium]|jgi:replicative DNA helicase|nr:AAA family ATPase [Candidatus Dojkabacteria bacterium]